MSVEKYNIAKELRANRNFYKEFYNNSTTKNLNSATDRQIFFLRRYLNNVLSEKIPVDKGQCGKKIATSKRLIKLKQLRDSEGLSENNVTFRGQMKNHIPILKKLVSNLMLKM